MLPDEVRKILVPLVMRFEGLRLKAYQDAGGVLTVGYGHTGSDVTADLVWTEAQAVQACDLDCEQHYNSLLRASPNLATESAGRQAALADFVYNLGVGNYMHSLLHSAVTVGAWQNVKAQLARWDHDAGKVLPGLTLRRQAEIDLIDT